MKTTSLHPSTCTVQRFKRNKLFLKFQILSLKQKKSRGRKKCATLNLRRENKLLQDNRCSMDNMNVS